MQEVYMVSAVRTAIGVFGGKLKGVPAHRLAASVLKEAVARAGIDAGCIDEIIVGEVRNGEVSNMARVAQLLAGFPNTIPAYTVNRLCASSMQAFKCGFQSIQGGDADVILVGGVENMSRAPVYINGDRFGREPLTLINSGTDSGRSSVPPELYGRDLSMLLTAQNVADRYGISREDQDLFAYQSQQKCAKALAEGKFKDEIIPIEYTEGKEQKIFDADEGPRPGITMEKLQKLKPLFNDGTLPAGNPCGRNDGASAVVLMSAQKVKELGVKPMAKVIASSASGVDPEIMGIGPIPAVRKVLKAAGLSLEDLDLIELNEAFASQSLAVIRELGLNTDILNVNGGAIALGHPLGNSGVRLLVTLAYEMNRRGSKRGLATMCVGGGQGMATIIEASDL